jgi:hypothetical protein
MLADDIKVESESRTTHEADYGNLRQSGSFGDIYVLSVNDRHSLP